MIARVLVDGPGEMTFDYDIPQQLAADLLVGQRVQINLRNRRQAGTVIGISEERTDDYKGALKPIEKILYDLPLLPPHLFELAEWISRYYLCPLQTVLKGLVPQTVWKGKKPKTRLVYELSETAKNLSTEEIEALEKKAPRQYEVIAALQKQQPLNSSEIAEDPTSISGALRALLKKELITSDEAMEDRDPFAGEEFIQSAPFALNEEQAEALAVFNACYESKDKKRPILLHGVTGSGKTEVYLQAIDRIIKDGKNAIVLVPEISLTPQTVERFKSRFAGIQEQVAVLHSHLSAGERQDEWHKVRRGEARIAIGARSAIFAPLDNIGVIIVDEEHDHSYKQESPPRYHGRDVAVMRAHLENCPVILGSATPSLESWHNVAEKKYQLSELKARVDNQDMPFIRIVDLRRELAGNRRDLGQAVLSRPLRLKMEERLQNGEQIILFLNRRGFSASLMCTACGEGIPCNHCSLPLTYHRNDNLLLCHLCGFRMLPPKACPECHEKELLQAGFGTQRVEKALALSFPEAKVARVDADAMSHKDKLATVLNSFKQGKTDILLGTQMIAKGLHFPNVTLVGVLHADLGLHVPDFRAGERVFQLMTQVAGRAGRGERKGEVIIQAYAPESSSIQFARHNDFAGFAEQELEFRKQFRYPPFTRILLLTARSEIESHAEACIENLHHRLEPLCSELGVEIGAALASPLIKAFGQYRFQILMRSNDSPALHRIARSIIEQEAQKKTIPKEVLLTWDIDPLNLS